MESKDVIRRLNKWYLTPLGKSLYEIESYYLNKLLPNFFGEYLLIEGANNDFSFFTLDKIQNTIYLLNDGLENHSRLIFVRAEPYELPFYNDCIDGVLLSHLLEYSENPYLILEEAFHTLVPNGKLIIFGFNPFSFWGLINRMNKTKNNFVPWGGRFMNFCRLRSWLLKLGFFIVGYETFNFKLPLQNRYFLKCCGFIDKIGKIIFPYFGGCYILIAEKKLLALTPLREKAIKKQVPLGACARPSANLIKHEE